MPKTKAQEGKQELTTHPETRSLYSLYFLYCWCSGIWGPSRRKEEAASPGASEFLKTYTTSPGASLSHARWAPPLSKSPQGQTPDNERHHPHSPKPARIFHLASPKWFTLPCLAFPRETPRKAVVYAFPSLFSASWPKLVLSPVALRGTVGPLLLENVK